MTVAVIFQTSPSGPQQAVGSQLSASDNVGPNHRQKMASDPFYQQACLESPRNWRAANPVRLPEAISPGPSPARNGIASSRISVTKVNLANNNLAFDV